MSAAREEVLARVRSALAGSEPSGAGGASGHGRASRSAGSAAPEDVPRRYLGPDSPWEVDLPSEDLLALLADRVVDYRATITAASPGSVGAVVAQLVGAATRVVSPMGLDAAWLVDTRAAGAELLIDSPGSPIELAVLDTVDAVVTASALAIAETGTIVLDGSPDQGRRVISLVPDHHICVVRMSSVVRGLPAAMSRIDIRKPLTWISGPSATSDIELSRVEGVHGPRRLDVVLLAD
jgi:L-lactate dehydrogenase complex protein LldG